jgi:RNA polymerase sigma factor (sigma-70 family)
MSQPDRRPPRIGESFPEVLAAARLGAEWAWTAIYRNLAPVVLSYLRARGVRDAEDVTGEVFLQVARDLPSFTGGEAEFRSWVLATTHHRFLDHYRYLRRRPVEPAEPATMGGTGPHGNVEEEALDNLASERVRRLIEALSPLQRDVLLLRIIGGFTVEEVARTIGKRPTSVKALQRRGLSAVRRALEAEAGVRV